MFERLYAQQRVHNICDYGKVQELYDLYETSATRR